MNIATLNASIIASAAPEGELTHGFRPNTVLVVDVGGSSVKVRTTADGKGRKAPSGRDLTAERMSEIVRDLAADWTYDAVSLGYPGLVGAHGPIAEPGNLGDGWVGFDYATALGRPVRVMNDAAMQALGAYEGGRMLFLGLGTGLGSTLIADGFIIPLELGALPHGESGILSDALGKAGLARLGEEAWVAEVQKAVKHLSLAFVAHYVVLGGGNAKLMKGKIEGVRLGGNHVALHGGLRLWNIESVAELPPEGGDDEE